MSSHSSSYILCPEAIDNDDRQTVTAFSAFESQLQTLCLKDFPGGTGSWVRQSIYAYHLLSLVEISLCVLIAYLIVADWAKQNNNVLLKTHRNLPIYIPSVRFFNVLVFVRKIQFFCLYRLFSRFFPIMQLSQPYQQNKH